MAKRRRGGRTRGATSPIMPRRMLVVLLVAPFFSIGAATAVAARVIFCVLSSTGAAAFVTRPSVMVRRHGLGTTAPRPRLGSGSGSTGDLPPVPMVTSSWRSKPAASGTPITPGGAGRAAFVPRGAEQQSSSFGGVTSSGGDGAGGSESNDDDEDGGAAGEHAPNEDVVEVLVIGAGWGGLSAAHALSRRNCSDGRRRCRVTVVDAAPRVGGLVRDGFSTINKSGEGKDEQLQGRRGAEAGQHGFWDNYHNIFHLLDNDLAEHIAAQADTAAAGTFGGGGDILTGYAEQGQYSPNGLEAVWPVYRDRVPQLPTGLAQALYTKFVNLPPMDRLSAAPLVLAFSEFDDSKEAWEKYDEVSFRDLCVRLGVSRRCYREAFEPMILTGLFAPGAECSAAAALGMAYFFVLRSQNSFDARWCRGNIGERIFDPWVDLMKTREENPVEFVPSTRAVGFDVDKDNGTDRITGVRCRTDDGEEKTFTADAVVFALGASALNGLVRNSPALAKYGEFRRFANLRGLGALATRLYLDRTVHVPYSANACWGFDEGVGMTFFDIGKLHGGNSPSTSGAPGSVIEVDYYHAERLLVMDDEDIVAKSKGHLDVILGEECRSARVVDAAVVKLPNAVNWYFPGSYADMPDARSSCLDNAYFVGDIVRSRHGSWSQEKAYVTGIEAANMIQGREETDGIIPLQKDEPHVAAGRTAVSRLKTLLGGDFIGGGPSLVDFIW